MDWTDQGFVLSARKHGESAAIVQLFTRAHGRHAGLVRGGAGSRARGIYQPGNLIEATWRARLADHLGTFTCELLESRAADLLGDPDRLAGLSAACAVAEMALPEREPHPAGYDGFVALLDALRDNGGDDEDPLIWPALYVRWEIGLLGELGYGLDLERCAATGRNDQLAYVSPKTGRAVSLSAGEPYRDRLFPLPGFLTGDRAPSDADIAAGLHLSGHFLDRFVFMPHERRLPAARVRLEERFLSA